MNPVQTSFQPSPRMMLADRQTEENLWNALAEQRDEFRSGLEHCVDVSYNCGPGYNQHLVRLTTGEKVARGLFGAAGLSTPVALIALMADQDLVAACSIVTAIGSMFGALIASSIGHHPPGEESWRANTLREIQALRQEASGLRENAERVRAESADLRMACGTSGAKSSIEVGEQNVTLGAVRIKRKG